MSAYLRGLNAQIAADSALQAEKREAACATARDRLTPLEDRLLQLLRGIPHELQQEGLALAALRQQLKGRWRGTCHPGELGAALRKIGFKRTRQWRDDDGFRTLWIRQ